MSELFDKSIRTLELPRVLKPRSWHWLSGRKRTMRTCCACWIRQTAHEP